MAVSDRDTISTGLTNFDELTVPEGYIIGTVGLWVSTPTTDVFQLFAKTVESNNDRSEMITFERSVKDVSRYLRDEFNLLEDEVNISSWDVENIGELIDEIKSMDLSDRDVLIVDSLNKLNCDEASDNFTSELKEIATDNGVTLIFHWIGDVNKPDGSNIRSLIYQSDFVYTVSKTTLDDTVRQQMYFEKLPPGVKLKSSQLQVPTIELEYIEGSISIGKRGRI